MRHIALYQRVSTLGKTNDNQKIRLVEFAEKMVTLTTSMKK